MQDATRDFLLGYKSLASMFGQAQFPLRSTVVLGALSAEIQLKLLIAKSGKSPPKAHKLRFLFGQLGPSVRDQVQRNWDQQAPKFSIASSLDEALTHIDEVFIDWRYLYEKQSRPFMLQVSSLSCLLECFQTIEQGS